MAQIPTDVPAPRLTFRDGVRASATSVFGLVIIGTYLGIGALAHDYGFSPVRAMLTTLLVWPLPARSS